MSFPRTDNTEESMLEPSIQLLPASRFSVEELTAAYNQTRVDYMVPMPMNAARLSAYLDIYDVEMAESVVAVEGEQILGLGMLGVRDGRTWITRLGVLPVRRRRGTGEAIMRGLLKASRQRNAGRVILEVIKGNVPAYELFRKLGFLETRELLVLRRPPNPSPIAVEQEASWLETKEAVEMFRVFVQAGTSRFCPAWTNEVESYENAGDALGLRIELNSGARGWMIFRRQKFTLSHLFFHTEAGCPKDVAAALLSNLYRRFPQMDTYTENLPADDPHWGAFERFGFIEAFRRIEMDLLLDDRANAGLGL